MTRVIALLTIMLVLVSGCARASFAQSVELPSAQDAIDGVFPGSNPKTNRVAKIDSKRESRKTSDPDEAAQTESVFVASVQHQGAEATATVEPSTVPDEVTPMPETVMPTPSTVTATPVEDRAPPKLWMDMSMGTELIDWFNATAYPSDIARADHVSRIDMLEQIEVGRRLVVFRNVADAEALLPRLHDKMDVIGYNLEHGPANREDRDDPVGSVRRMRELADEYGLELALGPDRTFAIDNGVEMAPYVDIFVLQVQRVQTEPNTVRSFVIPLASQFRAVNPDIEISVQIRTEGDPAEIADLILSMEDSIDAVSVLTSPESIDIAQALIAELRPDVAYMSIPTPTPDADGFPQPAPVGNDGQVMALPTPSSQPRKTHAATAVANTTAISSQTERDDNRGGLFYLDAMVTIGILLTGLIVSAGLTVLQKLRIR